MHVAPLGSELSVTFLPRHNAAEGSDAARWARQRRKCKYQSGRRSAPSSLGMSGFRRATDCSAWDVGVEPIAACATSAVWRFPRRFAQASQQSRSARRSLRRRSYATSVRTSRASASLMSGRYPTPASAPFRNWLSTPGSTLEASAPAVWLIGAHVSRADAQIAKWIVIGM